MRTRQPVTGPPRRAVRKPKEGFVLVIALMLMSFVLVLLLSITLLSQVELRGADTAKQQLLARQNARLGLMVALGNLQKYAGPDQRVTARADLLGDASVADGGRFWTGVWDTSDPSGAPIWLVSSPDDVPADPSAPGNALLFEPSGASPGGSALTVEARSVRVPSQPIGSSGSFAYWIADEGVKGSLAPVFDSDKLFNQNGLDLAILERDALQRTGLASGKPDFLNTAARTAANDRGFSLTRLQDLPLAWSSDTAEQTNLLNRLNADYHDYTSRSYGLLTHTLDGGFRHDLSSLNRLSPELSAPKHAWINEAVREGLNLWSEVQSGPIQPRVTTGSNSANDPSLRLTPIISELFLGTAISGNASTATNEEILLYYLLFAELWNPFTAPLNFSGRDTYDDIIVRVSGLPQVELINTTRGITRQVDIPPLILDLDFYDFIDGAQRDQFEPGRLTWTGNPRSSGSGSVIVEGEERLRRNGVYIISTPIGAIPGTTVEDFVGNFSAANITMEFFLKRTSFDDPNDPHELFWTLQLNGFDAFTIDYEGGDGVPNGYTGSPSQFFRPRNTQPHGVNRASINQSRNSFNYHFRIDEELFTPNNDDFAHVITNNALQRSVTSIDLKGSTSQGLNRVYQVEDLPEQVQRDITFSDLDFFSSKDSSFDTNPERWAYLIDLPRNPPTEIAQLNFLTFAENEFEKLGHPNTSDLNRLYDDYFMTGLRETFTLSPTIGQLTPNPRYQLIYDSNLTDFETLAGDLLVLGAFNINSTSPAAWAEFFAGSDLDSWPIGSGADPELENLRSTWFSMPDWGPRMFDPVFSGTDNYRTPLRRNGVGLESFDNFVLSNIPQNSPVPPAFRQGFRELEDGERQQLGQEISNRIRGRARPFFSIREFLDSGIIDEAIQAVAALNQDSAGNPIPSHSPAHFSQIKVTQNAGSRMSARSDTFQIITSGDYTNPVTGERSTAKCEARVQRLPKRLTGSGVSSPSERQFSIIDFKWIQ